MMYKKVLTISSLIAFSASCAQMIPARVQELGDNRYLLRASGNAFASPESMLKKIDKKAKKICGENGFKYEGKGDFKSEKSRVYMDGRMQETYYFVMERTIDCSVKIEQEK